MGGDAVASLRAALTDPSLAAPWLSGSRAFDCFESRLGGAGVRVCSAEVPLDGSAEALG
jgi:hypothetical protein